MTEDHSRLSVLYWIQKKEIKNEKGDQIEFEQHRFMLDPYSDPRLEQAMIKCTQVGATTMQTIISLHASKYWGLNQIYTLPTQADVRAYAQSKVNPIIKKNPTIRDNLDLRSVDSVEQKQFGDSFLFYRPTWSESKAIMITSDRNMHDEVDKSNQDVIESFKGRQGHKSPDEYDTRYFSTPTIPNFGIHQKWLESDQKHWRFNCPHCGHRQHLGDQVGDGDQKDWMKSICFERKVYQCKRCHGALDTGYMIRTGSWEAKYPARRISGYWVNWMMCPWVSAAQLIQAWEDTIDINKKDTTEQFYNFKLGMPYLPADKAIPMSLFLKNLTAAQIHDGPHNVMGMDCGGGKGNHVTIGNPKGLFWTGIVVDDFIAGEGPEICPYCNRQKEVRVRCGCRWERCADLIRSDMFNIEHVVMDGMPYTEEAFRLAKMFPYKVHLCWFNDDPALLEIIRYGDEVRTKKRPTFEDDVKVLVARTRIIDHTISLLNSGKIPIALPPDSAGLATLMAHAGTMYAIDQPDRNGQMKRIWQNTGANDFWLAFIYFVVALRKVTYGQ